MKFFRVIKSAATGFFNDDCMVSGAALAYYTIFSLPPLLVMIFFLAEWFGVSPERINQMVSHHVGIPVPAAGASAEGESASAPSATGGSEASLTTVVERRSSNTSVMESLGPVSKVIGVLLLVFSATGVFAQLQRALNQAWEVEPDPEQGGVVSYLMKRVLSLGMIVVIAFLLLVSLVLTSLLDEIVAMVSGAAPSQFMFVIGNVLNLALSAAMATLLFASVYKILPDAEIAWRDVWVGGLITALLFVAGKAAIGWYLNNSNLGSSWGSAAGSMVAMLVWVYYSSLIVLFGAEMTQAWAVEFGQGIKPAKNAVRVVVERRQAPGDSLPATKQSKKRPACDPPGGGHTAGPYSP